MLVNHRSVHERAEFMGRPSGDTLAHPQGLCRGLKGHLTKLKHEQPTVTWNGCRIRVVWKTTHLFVFRKTIDKTKPFVERSGHFTIEFKQSKTFIIEPL